ncbi:MAG: hypothetical protein Harvfovirus15_27 [Harvfovirus sp.]|uniref:Uncharacterized protein n=1 Tax=Harvfovirus sp. TaxID=2487768 RepID=A0A3G5A5I5_9VIRU|nr:MAG: hypothetical protein Harvfovirus15_27 [Harvfovirus sp.]
MIRLITYCFQFFREKLIFELFTIPLRTNIATLLVSNTYEKNY